MRSRAKLPLTMTDAHLREAAERFGTPLYLYDLDHVSAQLGQLQGTLPEAEIYYALKANANGALLRHLAAQGVGAEVITLGELERAHRAGISGSNLLLGGPGQDAALLRRTAELGVKQVSLDSVSQWERWRHEPKNIDFFLRVNPALDPRTHEHLATGAAYSKFGMTPEDAAALAEALEAKGQLAGFHVHAGSQISDERVYDEIFAVLEPLYSKFPSARRLDIGGGFAVPGFDLEAFAAKLGAFCERFELRPLVEPGRYLVAEAGVLLTRVLHVKDDAVRHVIADAGMADLLRPALYGAEHPIRVLGREGELKFVDVDGPLCENADRLGRGLELPEVAAGDLLVVEQAGAYGFGMASNYASSLRPAEVVLGTGELRLARRRERPEDLVVLEC